MRILKSLDKSAFFVTLMLSCNSLSLLLSFIPGISVIVVMASLIGFILVCRQPLILSNIKNLFFFVFIILLGYARQLLAGNWCPAVQDCFLSFVFFGIPFLYVSCYNLDYKKIILYLMLIGIVLTPINIRDCMLEYFAFDSEEGQMKASYNILFYIVPSIIVVFGDYSNKIKLLAVIESMIGCIFLVSFGSKGAILATLICVILVLLYRKNEQIKIFSTRIVVAVLLGYLLLSNYEFVLVHINDLLEEYGLVTSSIPELLDKIALEDNDKLTSGRTIIYQNALNQIKERPIFGYGIAAFDGYSGAYPHNLFIQLLYEGGIVVLVPYMLLFLAFIRKMNVKYLSLETRSFLIFLLSAGLMRLMFSHNFWVSQLFWFSIGVILKDFRSRKMFQFM